MGTSGSQPDAKDVQKTKKNTRYGCVTCELSVERDAKSRVSRGAPIVQVPATVWPQTSRYV